jgi:RNA polymerase sigma factor (sigma-70 family)
LFISKNGSVLEEIKNKIIWDEFRNGSKIALSFIYEENYSSLNYYGLKFTTDKELVKDLIQELFVELIDSGLNLSSTDNIRFYLLKALRYKLTNHITRISKYTHTDLRVLEFSFLDSIENQLIKKEVETDLQVKMKNAICKLSEKQQEIIYLRFFNDLSYPEIAKLFGVEMQTVRNLMSRAIKTLKDDLNNGIGKSLILMVLRSRF